MGELVTARDLHTRRHPLGHLHYQATPGDDLQVLLGQLNVEQG